MKFRSPKKLMRILRKAGYTQVQIAEHTGIPQSTLSRLETGSSKDPRISTVWALEKMVDTLEGLPELDDEEQC